MCNTSSLLSMFMYGMYNPNLYRHRKETTCWFMIYMLVHCHCLLSRQQYLDSLCSVHCDLGSIFVFSIMHRSCIIMYSEVNSLKVMIHSEAWCLSGHPEQSSLAEVFFIIPHTQFFQHFQNFLYNINCFSQLVGCGSHDPRKKSKDIRLNTESTSNAYSDWLPICLVHLLHYIPSPLARLIVDSPAKYDSQWCIIINCIIII